MLLLYNIKIFLVSKEQEVVDIMMTLFDDEQILKAIQKILKIAKKEKLRKE